jgi:CO/xanthine dehydrogenase Mo-binding subunit
MLAWTLGLKESDVRIISHYVGGGFGSKTELDAAQFCSSLLSMKLCRPVKIVFTREEEFAATRRRTPMYYYVKTGVKKNGTFMAKEARVFTDGGAYTSLGPTALYLTGFFQSFPYKWPSYKYDGYRVYPFHASFSDAWIRCTQALCRRDTDRSIAADLKMNPIEIRA